MGPLGRPQEQEDCHVSLLAKQNAFLSSTGTDLVDHVVSEAGAVHLKSCPSSRSRNRRKVRLFWNVGDTGLSLHFVLVVNFMRTPNWYLPRAQAEYSTLNKFLFAYVPGYMRLHRYKIAFNLEFNSIIFPLKYSAFRNYVEEGAMAHMKSTAPEKYHQMLTPQYPIGCKRVSPFPFRTCCPNCFSPGDPLMRALPDRSSSILDTANPSTDRMSSSSILPSPRSPRLESRRSMVESTSSM